VFTARYALSPYIKQIRFLFKGLISECIILIQRLQEAVTHSECFVLGKTRSLLLAQPMKIDTHLRLRHVTRIIFIKRICQRLEIKKRIKDKFDNKIYS
jgi:hypothetical protein